jgi:hypothetical protein
MRPAPRIFGFLLAVCFALPGRPTAAFCVPAGNPPARPPAADPTGVLAVTVRDASDGERVPYANLLLPELARGFLVDGDGNGSFAFPPGSVRFRVVHVAYEESADTVATIAVGDTTRLVIELEPRQIQFPPVVVRSERREPVRAAASASRALRAQDVAALPNPQDDPFQMIRILPGVRTEDVGSEFHMRGGGAGETLVRLDGMEIENLFHGRDFGGLSGVVPFGVIERMDVYLGGYPARYGGKLSGVLDVDLRSRGKPGPHAKIGADALSARVLGEVNTERTSTLLSVREGYLDRVLSAVQDSALIRPSYRDLLLRQVFRPGLGHTLSLNYLRSEDHLLYEDGYDKHLLNSDYIDHYLWSTWRLTASRSFGFSGTLYGAQSRQLRVVGVDGWDNHRLRRAGGRLELDVLAPWGHYFRLGGQLDREWGSFNLRGGEIVRIGASGNLESVVGFHEAGEVDRTLSAAFVQDEWRPFSWLAFNLGMRTSHDSDSHLLRFNPRASGVLRFPGAVMLTGAWGFYDQPAESDPSDDVARGYRSRRVQRAEHVVAGLEKKMGQVRLGVEAYRKEFPQLDGVVTQISQGVVERNIVTHGRARGMEAYLEWRSSFTDWWLGYALSSSEWGNAERTFYRGFDQRHSFTLTSSFHLGPAWSIGSVYTFHSGAPYTFQSWVRDPATRSWILTERFPFGARLPSYHRIDLRIVRRFQFDGWRMSVYAEGLNLTNHDNVLWYTWGGDRTNSERPVRITRTGLPAVPSLGLEIEF